jgi:Cys-rich protein (TIGR01571 family)
MAVPSQRAPPLILFDAHSTSRLTTSGLQSSDNSLSVGSRSTLLTPCRQQYTTGLLDVCSDPRSSAEAVFCSCCLVARMYNMLWQREPTVDTPCCTLMTCFALCPLPPCASVACGTAYVRAMALDRLDLADENSVVDCLISFFCLPCSIAQLYRELSLRRLWPGSMCSNERPCLSASLSGASASLAMRLPPVMGRVCSNGISEQQRSSSLSLQLPLDDHRTMTAVVNPLLRGHQESLTSQ